MEWIDVKKRLPDKIGSYLVARQRDSRDSHGERAYQWVEICSWSCALTAGKLPWKDAWVEYSMGGSFEAGGVTHWMPLPEPPK